MNNKQNFLVRYGLQYFVSVAPIQGKQIFAIQSKESSKMVNHAKKLIQENFGESIEVQII